MPIKLEELESCCKNLARVIKGALPPMVGMTLILYDYGSGGNMTYLSTAKRKSMISMLRELATKLEQSKN